MNKEQIAQLKELIRDKQVDLLTKKMDDLIEVMKKRPEPHYIMQVPSEVHMSNFEPAPDKVKVSNFPEAVKVSNFPEAVKVSNFPEAVKVTNFPEQKEIQKVEIINQKQEKDNTPFFSKLITKAAESIAEVFRGLWEGGIAIKQNTKKNPIYVINIDEKGAPVGQASLQVFGGGGGSTTSAVPTVIKSGKVAVDVPGTAVVLGEATTKTKKITISASFNNAGIVWVGDSAVSATNGIGVPLLQGATYQLEINNLASIFIDAENAGDAVSFVALS
ncbi:hypothetical protein GW943_03425 [Candidatus Parcubacteria bacterium]|nr:hypothetical protein [Candidatus Parcubacteria bacterium]